MPQLTFAEAPERSVYSHLQMASDSEVL